MSMMPVPLWPATPTFQVPVQVKVAIQDNHGRILIALEDLKKLSQEEFNKLEAVTGGNARKP
jgi:hypothetical protein